MLYRGITDGSPRIFYDAPSDVLFIRRPLRRRMCQHRCKNYHLLLYRFPPGKSICPGISFLQIPHRATGYFKDFCQKAENPALFTKSPAARDKLGRAFLPSRRRRMKFSLNFKLRNRRLRSAGRKQRLRLCGTFTLLNQPRTAFLRFGGGE